MTDQNKPGVESPSDRPARRVDDRWGKAYLRDILDINPHLVFAKDREGRFTLVNQAVADMYGTSVEDLLGKKDADFVDDEAQVAFFRKMDLQVMDTLEEAFIAEEKITDSEGNVHWLQTVKRPIVGADGRANEILGVATDITARKEAEQERQALEEQLRHSQKMDALGQLAGGVAHDFNNILAVILGNAERLMHQLESDASADEGALDGVRLIASSCERAASLIRQLVAFSRKQPVNPVAVELNELVTDLKAMLHSLIGEHIEFETVLSDKLPCVQADPSQLEQLVVNLVVNARDAMPDGGRLSIETAAVVMSDDGAAYVRISVSDTGAGIPVEHRNRLFEPFFTTKERGKGTGLGLSTVFGIVKQAGGHIEFDTEVGRGTTFHVYWPATLDRPQAQPENASARPPVSATVLVCEDEPDVLSLTATTLREHGCQVLTAENGDAALGVAERHEGVIDALVTDVVMPGMQGPQLAARLRDEQPGIRVLYVTAHAPESLPAGRADGDGDSAWLSKPFKADELLAALGSVLS